MKVLKNIIIPAVLIVFAAACNEGIDPIAYVNPGPDAASPVVNVISPTEGQVIDVDSLLTSVKIQVEVTDDIELGSVDFLIDGMKITGYTGTDFRDYRRFLKEYMYKEVTLGDHVLSVKATDLEGKVTTKTVNFKRPPYTPLYDGEVFYMPFNGTYMEKVSFTDATVVGTPGFTGGAQAVLGSNAYKGAADSYLTFPTTGLTGGEFSAVFWYKVNSSQERAGILNASPTGQDRTKGFRLFREGGTTIKLNVGTGGGETWCVGPALSDKDWVHVAITISGTKAIIYVNGTAAGTADNTGLDWTGCDVFGIGSGAPNFTYWGHGADLSSYDELRLFDKALTQAEIQTIIDTEHPYTPKYSGEVFYMPFDGSYKDLDTKAMATIVGTPSFAAGKIGQAYAGATDSYLVFPTTEFVKSTNFSAVWWMKINAVPDRAGILVAGPVDLAPAVPGTMNNRTSGFRFFREVGAAPNQRFKLNAGNGTADSWFDGGGAAEVDPGAGGWHHFAFSISGTECAVYIDGQQVSKGPFTGLSWAGCDILTIMSGYPRFTEWNHLSDLSLMDELRIFNIALSQAQVQAIYNDEN